MWKLYCKKCWALKNWCFWTVELNKTLKSPLDYKEIQPINPIGNQSWIFIGRTDAEIPILWLPDVKNWVIEKVPDDGKGWRLEEMERTEDEMVGLHHWLIGHEFEQSPSVCNGQGSLVCCNPLGRKELNSTEQLNWTDMWLGAIS